AGAELVERALLGSYRQLFGTDLDTTALEGARLNLDAAGVDRAKLIRADACTFQPEERPTLILTNPPMGRRVLDRTKTGPLYEAFLAHAAKLLRPGGRLAWISPRPQATARIAARVGLRATARRSVDMGGFNAELQVFVKEAPKDLSSGRTPERGHPARSGSPQKRG
ncbi:MAG: methyltransferase, partial [Polyangiaceae bacterium]|nr:methyltransferase [Polyangiaceae bacterium]